METTILLIITLMLLFIISICLRVLNIKNKPKCGCESNTYTYVSEYEMWMCPECLEEYRYDRMKILR